jgi:NhaP-type Na+/H+ or K+/H+ antiporter
VTENLLLGMASIIVLGILAQWTAWRLGIPSILLLLVFGFLAGPITGFLNPDALLGDILFPVVSASVAVILFEGGLSLRLTELRTTAHVVRNLVTIGAFLTWLMSSAAAYYILNLNLSLALLLGAILVVTGPTVIMPLLRQVRTVGPIGSIVKWEGIVNDPIGAVLAVLVFEAIITTGIQAATMAVAISLLQTVLIGLVLGGVFAALLIFLLARYWIPDYLQNGVTLMFVLGVFAASDLIQKESGLFTVTLMGIILANQRYVSLKHIIEFKENLGVLLLSGLFIILSARLNLDLLTHLGWSSVAFLATLVLIVRPVAVIISTFRSGLSWREKLFLSWMAPRGIVAAAVTSVFALELAEKGGFVRAELMVPEMFVIIVGTVTIYGLSAAPLGRWLKLAQPNPQGVMIAGAHAWAQKVGGVLQDEGYQVLLVDTNRANIHAARLAGLPVFFGSILSEFIQDEIELGSLGRLLALTSNDEVNSLAALHFIETFGRSGVYQLPPKQTETDRKETVSSPLRGRLLFGPEATYARLTQLFNAGYVIKKTKLTERFSYADYQETYNGQTLSLFLIDELGDLRIFTTENQLKPRAGHTLISLVAPLEEAAPSAIPALTLSEVEEPQTTNSQSIDGRSRSS